MNNTLNPCKCDSGTGTGGDASDVIYDGLSVDCLPGLVGQNLATAIKRIGDALCDVESGAISVTVNPGAPTGGENGDLWFRQQGNVVSVYQHNGTSWDAKGDLVMGGNTYTPDPNLPDPPTNTYLNSTYPTAKPGDTVYWEGTTQIVTATCYAVGEWKWITENRCQ